MKLPVIRGLIRRRLLVNFRVDAEVMQKFLPRPFRPKLHRGYAIAGICLIRLEKIRPAWLPEVFGISSENAAHRVAVTWVDPHGTEQEGVFIPRRDTSSWLNAVGGGRFFPGVQRRADFDVTDENARIAMSIRSRDGAMSVDLRAKEADILPPSSCFGSLEETSEFFRGGSAGFSLTRDCCRLDGIQLETEVWKVRPLDVEKVESSFFGNPTIFPHGSAEFDHALIMRDILHEWHGLADLHIESGSAPALV